MNSKTVVLAAGGTGGHIFPAEALAQELSARGYTPVLVTDKRYTKYKPTYAEMKIHVIDAASLSGGFIRKISAMMKLTRGYFQSRGLLKRLKPIAVVGFGGYPSFPTMLAAAHMKCVTVLHEQNSLVGQANYLIASKVRVIATSFEEVRGLPEHEGVKTQFTGNPVRQAIRLLSQMDYPAFDEQSVLRILVTGGSQGAGIFGKVVPEAVALLPEEMQKRIRIDQQCREDDMEAIRLRYRELGVSADLATFFSDIPSRLASCHLVIARSGASTIAELAVAGRPAILVPLPSAKNDHQTVNANTLEEKGAAWLIPQESFTPKTLAEKLERLVHLPAMLKEAATKMRQAGQPEAAKRLADLVLRLAPGAESVNNVSAANDFEKSRLQP